jgi:membrane-associated phospholipid phosphatase
MLVESLTRPYPVSIPMVVLLMLVPIYVYIPGFVSGRTLHAPELSLDRAVPLVPAWALVYGSLYLFLIVLPVFVVRQQEHIRRTVFAYLTVWVTAYVCFLIYPTVAPRPGEVVGEGFAVSGLRFLYSADPPYNCFPSIHVAHSFVSALAVHRTHRAVGVAATLCAVLVAASTLFSKQHYVLDVVAGTVLAWVAYMVFLRRLSRETVSELDHRVAPVFALVTIGIVCVVLAGSWLLYMVSGVS